MTNRLKMLAEMRTNDELHWMARWRGCWLRCLWRRQSDGATFVAQYLDNEVKTAFTISMKTAHWDSLSLWFNERVD